MKSQTATEEIYFNRKCCKCGAGIPARLLLPLTGKGTAFRGCGKTRSAEALKGRDFQSRRKNPTISTAASAAESRIPPLKEFFLDLFQSCRIRPNIEGF